MIVTRSWLEEFIELGDISNEKLYETFNSIGLEVDSINKISIPDGVVIGKILSCEKHPNADKLNVCQIDIGEGIRQIVCGAANVVDAEFVAVATIGTKLTDDFQIKPTELRGQKSDGMVCSSTELGLPDINDGIMILDDSIGILDVGRELNEYDKIADTVIELELTANRGDCLSIHGVARDLSAALERNIKSLDSVKSRASRFAMARRLSLSNNTDTPLDLLYNISTNESIMNKLIIELRLSLVGLELENKISNIVKYSVHATGVILRAYDMKKLEADKNKVTISLENSKSGLVYLKKESDILAKVGISQNEEYLANDDSSEILYEASYISPDFIVESVTKSKIDTDILYYKTSRGSEPDLYFGLRYLENQCLTMFDCSFSDSYVSLESNRKDKVVAVNFNQIDSIIGQETSRSKASSILSRLGFDIHRGNKSGSFGTTVPPHRHDIQNIQDIAEEVLRIVGINNIQAKPLRLVEKVRLTDTTLRYKAKKELRLRAVGRGFFEAVTYAFSDKDKLEKYGFDIVDDSKKLVNPIAEEFNAMRSTLLINLLDSVKRNVSYGIKRIPLFEIGMVFDSNRNENEKIAFVWSGNADIESVSNHGKSKSIDFQTFMERLSSITGDISLTPCEAQNALMHPYQSASVVKNGKTIGFVGKLHPAVAQSYGIPDTILAELDFSALVSEHIIAKPISNYQGVYKDLSVVVENSLSFSDISLAIKSIDERMLKGFNSVDIYEDKSLGDNKSLTIRFFIQSMEGTLSDKQIDGIMKTILNKLENDCKATLR